MSIILHVVVLCQRYDRMLNIENLHFSKLDDRNKLRIRKQQQQKPFHYVGLLLQRKKIRILLSLFLVLYSDSI